MSYVLLAGLEMYDLLAGRLGLGRHRRLGPQRAVRMVPCLKEDGLTDAFIYYDAQTDDTRLTSTVVRTAVQAGARAANYAEVMGFTLSGGRIVSAQINDLVSGRTLDIKVGTVVNAGGAFAGRIEASDSAAERPQDRQIRRGAPRN
jgi:glycerol-3-phosphate dehydrogenase